MANEVMEYVLGEAASFGVKNRSRRVGTKAAGVTPDPRPQIRFSFNILRPFPIAQEAVGSAEQRFMDWKMIQYLNVDTASRFPMFDGKTEAELSEAELLGVNGKVFDIDLSKIAPGIMEEFDAENVSEKSSIEPEFKTVATSLRNASTARAKQLLEAGDTEGAATFNAKAKEFTAAYIKAVYNGTYTGSIETSEARVKGITKKVDAAKKVVDTDADL